MSAAPLVLTIDAAGNGPTISRHLFGHFAEHLGRCVYEGLWVGEDSPIPHVRGLRSDVVAALREIQIPNLRWPGGCFADAYHWRDGLGPRDKRPLMRNDVWGQIETNAFGTHEFLDLCAQLGCEPVICGNLGSGTVREMRDWVEYLNAPTGTVLADERAANGHAEPFRVRFWGVGNESWGCGGVMRAEYYADEFRRYSNYLGNYEKARLFRIATGPGVDDYHWTEVMMRECTAPKFHPTVMDGLSLHYYMNGGCPPDFWATRFGVDEWNLVMAHGWHLDTLIRQHRAIMDRHDPQQRVALVVDEWGAWYTCEPGTRPNELFQLQTLRDAVLAALSLNILIAHAERVRMANIAQVVNVLHAMVLTFGAQIVRTPSWHVFKLYAVHHDATRLAVHADVETRTHRALPYPRVSTTASRDAAGRLHLTLAHTEPAAPLPLEIRIGGNEALSDAHALLVAADALNAENTLAQPDRVAARPFTAFVFDPARRVVALTLPPACVLQFSLGSAKA